MGAGSRTLALAPSQLDAKFSSKIISAAAASVELIFAACFQVQAQKFADYYGRQIRFQNGGSGSTGSRVSHNPTPYPEPPPRRLKVNAGSMDILLPETCERIRKYQHESQLLKMRHQNGAGPGSANAAGDRRSITSDYSSSSTSSNLGNEYSQNFLPNPNYSSVTVTLHNPGALGGSGGAQSAPAHHTSECNANFVRSPIVQSQFAYTGFGPGSGPGLGSGFGPVKIPLYENLNPVLCLTTGIALGN